MPIWGALICVIKMRKACLIGMRVDWRGDNGDSALGRNCTSVRQISLARSMFGTGGASAEGFLFLSRPTGRFTVVGMCPRSLGKNDETRCSSLLMALKNRVTLAIALVHD